MTFHRQEYREENTRRLRQGILWSLALHGVLLGTGLTVPSQTTRQDDQAVMSATLAVRLTASAAVQSLAPPPVRQMTPKATDTRAAPLPPSPPSPAVAPQTEVSAASAVLPASTLAVGAEASAGPSASTASAPTATASAVAPSSGTLDADALRSYRIALAAQARRFKRYPPQAMAAGWEGTAEVRLSLPSAGKPTVDLARSAGQVVLDRAAVTMIDAAAARVALPASLQGREFSITLPVMFSLNDP